MERRKDNKGRVLEKGESQRENGTYMFRYSDAGERKTIYAKSLSDLRKKEKEIFKKLEEGIHDSSISFGTYIENFIKENSRIKERTRKKYLDEYYWWIKGTWISKKKLDKVKKSDIVKFYAELSEERGLSDGTIKSVHKYISGSMQKAFEDDLIRRNYAKGCTEDYNHVNKRKSLTKEQTSEFFDYADSLNFGLNYLLGMKLMFLSGLRFGEMAGLTWEDVDLEHDILDINHQFVCGDKKSRSTYHIDVTKTENGKRKVPISKELHEIFEELKELTYVDSYKFNSEVDGYKGFVIHSRTGLPVLNARYNDYCKKVVYMYNSDTNKEKLPHITCHIARHTFITRMAELNMNQQALMRIVGHSSYKTTSDVYISVSDDFVWEEFYKVMRGKN